jgi:hypothetical protein
MLSQAWRTCGSYNKVKKLPPGKFAKMIRTYFAMCLIHDILPVERVEVDMLQSYYMALDDFGHWDAEFIPYWTNAGIVTTDSPDIKISIYRKKGKLLICAVNMSTKKWTGKIKLDLQKSGLVNSFSGKNMESGEKLNCADGSVENAVIEGHDFVIYQLKN